LADSQVLTNLLYYSPSINRTGGEKCNEKLIAQNKDREMPYQLPSWVKQT